MKRGMKAHEIVIIVAILAVIAAIAIPNLLETTAPLPLDPSAIANLRLLTSVQAQYVTRYMSYADFAALCNAGYIDDVLGQGTEADYTYVLKFNADKWWCCIARPVIWGSGPYQKEHPDWDKRNYLVSTDGVIYYNETENSSEFTEKLGE